MKFLILALLLVSTVTMASDTMIQLHVQRQSQMVRISKIENALKSKSVDSTTRKRLVKILNKQNQKLQLNSEMIKLCIEFDSINEKNELAKK